MSPHGLGEPRIARLDLRWRKAKTVGDAWSKLLDVDVQQAALSTSTKPTIALF
jgi:hypothetical protein